MGNEILFLSFFNYSILPEKKRELNFEYSFTQK